MRICVVGSGYVGLVQAACLADSGNHVVGVDIDPRKVESLSRGESPIFERGLEELLRSNLAALRLRFTTDLADALRGAKVAFIAVGTPGLPDGSADMSAILRVAGDIGRSMQGPLVVVTKSTVPVGTGARIAAELQKTAQHEFHVVSNPEFLKEGTAVDDFMRPDRVVIGAENAAAAELVAELYRPFVRNNKPILLMSRAAAEMTKYAANAYLATRISFINEVAEICEKLGVDVDEVRRGIGLDARIGQHFLYPGLGYGGSCFPKDVRALAHTARQAGAGCAILDAVDRRNVAQRENMLARIRERLGPQFTGKRIAIWGLAFKPNTDDIREAPGMFLAQSLAQDGARVAVHDPKALEAARAALSRSGHAGESGGDSIEYCHDPYAALKGAEALVACTEWMEYRSPDFDLIRRALTQPLIFDGRNIYDRAMMKRHGFEYYSVGRPAEAARIERAPTPR